MTIPTLTRDTEREIATALHHPWWCLDKWQLSRQGSVPPMAHSADFKRLRHQHELLLILQHASKTPSNNRSYVLTRAIGQSERLPADADPVFLIGSSSQANVAAAASLMARADNLKISGPVLNMLIVCHPLHSLEGLHEFKSDLQMKDPLFLTACCGTAIRPTHLTAAMISRRLC